MNIGNIIRGMEIIRRHTGDDEYCVGAEHDILYCGGENLPLTADERAEMDRIGWFISENSWACFT